MILIADSGGSKTDWRLILQNGKIDQASSPGFNPYYQPVEDLKKNVQEILLPMIPQQDVVDRIYFYGAGVSSVKNQLTIKSAFLEFFPQAQIEIGWDLLAAARALCGKEPGIACIMGTGSNSCLYDGKNIIDNVANLGIPVSTTEGDFDYNRAKKGGLDAPFMSIYIPSSNQQKPDMGKALADTLIDMIEGIARAIPDKFALARTPQEIEHNSAQGKISLPLGMENGAPLGDDLSNLKYFFDRGIRYITLTHGKDNQICDSSYDSTYTWNGLSPFGEKVVAEMNRLGIMVDISHVSDSAFYDVMKITKAPAIASHSSCRYFTPGFERNMSDDMIRRLAENGGVIQINFGASFLDSVARKNDKLRDSLEAILVARDLTSKDPAAQPVINGFAKQHKELYSDVTRVADHIDHVVKLVGIDHVGIGSDYDGVGDSLPVGLKDVSTYPNLIAELLKRGYSAESIEKICYKNVFRVWNRVMQVAENS